MSFYDLVRGNRPGVRVRLAGRLPPRDSDRLVLYVPEPDPHVVLGRDGARARLLPQRGCPPLPARRAFGLLEPEEDDLWSLWTFAPPTVLPCTVPLPVRVSAELVEHSALAEGTDLLDGLTWDFGGAGRLGVVAVQHLDAGLHGQERPLAIYHHGRRHWLIVRPRFERDRAWLEITDEPIRHRAFDQASYLGPNALLVVSRAGSWKVSPDGTTDAAHLLPLQSLSRGTIAGWARYVALDAEERERAFRARARHPIAFDGGAQSRTGAAWEARVHVSSLGPDAIEAWFPNVADRGRHHRLGVPVCVKDLEGAGSLTLEQYVPESSDVVRVTLKSSSGHPSLPAKGALEAVEDRGGLVKGKRERAALERLFSGGSAAPNLLGVLEDPSSAQAADRPKLLQTPARPLNAEQRDAVRKILGCRDLVAILGPPGTGKTSVIAEALRQIAAKATAENAAYRVLISSVQNEAVRNVVERVADQSGLVVHHVVSRSQTDEGRREEAEAAARQREGVVRRLRESLASSTVARRRAEVREAAEQLAALRRRARARPHDTVLAALSRPEVRTAERLELETIAAALTRSEIPPEVATDTSPEIAAAPSDAGDVTAWWEVTSSLVPPEHRAALQVRVDEVLRHASRASARPVAARRLATALDALQRDVGRLRPTRPPAASEPEPGNDVEAAVERLDAVLASIGRRLQEDLEALDREPDAIAQRFLDAIAEDVRAWDVIVDRHGNTTAGTCSMSGRDAGTAPPYDWVIVDEAGRATPPELLIPIVQGRRVVLIGDHLQLPPTVEEALVARVAEEGSASAIDFEETLFQRIFDQLPPDSRVSLSTQYRMHGDIGSVVDRLFYRPHKLALYAHFSGALAADRRPTWGRFRDEPLVFVPVRRRGTPHPEENPEEVRALLQILEGYVGAGLDGNTQDDRIGVLVPYAQQRRLVRAAVDQRPDLARATFIGTIDAMQGREFRVVCFCTTRTDGRPGFMAAPNRVNVALSRAQRQLVVLGHPETLGSKVVQRRAPHLHQLLVQHLRKEDGHWFDPEGTRWEP